MGNVKILKASAGSGKTYKLAYEFVRNVIVDPYIYKHILAVTFTNKATEEMKQRILNEINTLATGSPSPYMNDLLADTGLSESIIRKRAMTARTKILHDYSHFAILTIDKFFQRIIRAFIKELGVDLNFNLELHTDTLLDNAADNLIDDISTNEDLKRWIVEFVDERIDQNKKWDIKDELKRLGSEIFKEHYKVGNTTISKEKLAKIVSQASTKAAAIKEGIQNDARRIMELVEQCGLSVSDFPYSGSGFMGFTKKAANGTIAQPTKRVYEAVGSQDKWYSKSSPRKNDIIELTPKLMPLLELVCANYDENIRFLNSTSLLKENYRKFALLSDLSQKINELCVEGNIMPLSETNNILRKLISGNDTPFIFEKAGNFFSHFMIDEFQDTSQMQWENFIPLLKNAVSQSEESPVLIVGDVKQSIYRWRGGDWNILAKGIKAEFDESSEHELGTNYRSKRNIVDFNNVIIDRCIAADNNQLNEMLSTAATEEYITRELCGELTEMLSSAYEGHTQKTKSDKKEGYINITQYAKKDAEGSDLQPPVIDRIEDLQERGYAPSDIAILIRNNKEGVTIANMLFEHKSKNPDSKYCYDVVTQEALTIGYANVVRFIVAVLKLSKNIGDPISKAIYNRWRDTPVGHDIVGDEGEFISSLETLSPLEAFEKIVMRYELNNKQSDITYLQAMHEQIISFGTSTISDIPLFLKWWDEKGCDQSINLPESKSSITIITIHKAKGLQYKAVVIPFCEWSLIPSIKTILWAKSDATQFAQLPKIPMGYKNEIGESYFAEDYYRELVLSHIDNINIFYVAVTRAEEELHIMIPRSKNLPANKISGLILQSVCSTESGVAIGEMDGRATNEECGDVVWEFGEKMVVSGSDKKTKGSISTKFISRTSESKVRLRLQSQRYFAELGSDISLSPRSYGILMHKVFEQAQTSKDIDLSLDKMRQSGQISESELILLQERIAKSFTDPLISSWFDGSWQSVRNENDIIVPQSRFTRRPDRVMTNDKRAVIIDYKFGLVKENSHTKQIQEYASLLKSMGYIDINGYLWYVSLEEVVEIEI